MTKDERVAIEKLAARFEEFVQTYETDMRGSSRVDGNPGMIGEIRKLKEYIEKYPSITYLFAIRPFKIIGTIVAMFIILSTLWSLGLLKVVATVLGVPTPLP